MLGWLPVALPAKGYARDRLTRLAAGGLVKSELAQASGRKQEVAFRSGAYNYYYVYYESGFVFNIEFDSFGGVEVMGPGNSADGIGCACSAF